MKCPSSFLSIDQAARDAIYVRLLNRHSNENWNHLFSGDFVAFGDVDQDLEDLESHPAATVEDEQQTQEFVELQDDPSADWTLVDGFGEDIFGEDFADSFSAQSLLSDSTVAIDIEAAFSNLSRPEDGRDEICGVEFQAFEDNYRAERRAPGAKSIQ